MIGAGVQVRIKPYIYSNRVNLGTLATEIPSLNHAMSRCDYN